jgi:hypothetical protein
VRASIVLSTLLASFLTLMPATAGSQDRPRETAKKNWTPPRTPDGQPDIQGFYTHIGFGTGKEERPAQLCPPGAPGSNGCYESVWGQDTNSELKVKLPMEVTDPPDGKLPLQPWAAAIKEEYKKEQGDPHKLEHIDTQTRCLHTGVPRSDWAITYVGYEVIQGPGYVALYTEYNHQFRFIPLDRRPPLGPNIKLFGGNSSGHWVGNTLTVETTDIAVPRATGFGFLDMQGTLVSDALRVIERFTLVDPNTIAIEVTLEDPKVYTRPWTTAGAWVRAPKDYRVFEYACHEGNRGMENLSFRIPKKK